MPSPDSPTDRDALLRELSDTVAALQDLPEDAYEARARLRERRNELRAALADATEGRTRASLEQELHQLEERLERLHEQRPNVAASSGAGEGDDGIAEAMRMARQFDDGQGRAELEARIGAIRRALDAFDGVADDER